MIRATDTTADLAAMLETLERVMPLFGKNNQIGVTARPGVEDQIGDALGWIPDDVEEADYSDVTEPFRGTVFERLLRELPIADCLWPRAAHANAPEILSVYPRRSDTPVSFRPSDESRFLHRRSYRRKWCIPSYFSRRAIV